MGNKTYNLIQQTKKTKISKENSSLYGSSKLDQIKNDVEVESMKDVA